MTATLERAMISINRAAEYFSVKELEAQTGRGRSEFAAVCLKELVDNALDACETAGVVPMIDIQITSWADALDLVVDDNGPGIAPETVARILDFDTRTSEGGLPVADPRRPGQRPQDRDRDPGRARKCVARGHRNLWCPSRGLGTGRRRRERQCPPRAE